MFNKRTGALPANFIPLAWKVSDEVGCLVIDLTLLSVFLLNTGQITLLNKMLLLILACKGFQSYVSDPEDK
jgi:hypothetical protein